MRKFILFAALISSTASAEPIDPKVVNAIVDSAFNHGEVSETASYLADRIGSRLPNSPGMRQAEGWTQSKFQEWGLGRVRAEGFHFGRGWWIESSDVQMMTPRRLALNAIPLAWTPATSGTLTAAVIIAPMVKKRDFDAWRGKLAGKIVLISYPEPAQDPIKAPFKRFSNAEIAEFDSYEREPWDPQSRVDRHEGNMFLRDIDNFLKAEGALAWATMSRRDGRRLHGELGANSWKVGQTFGLPAVELAAEDYRRLARLAKTGPVTLAINNNVHFEDTDHNAYNILADIPGRDPKAGYVMAGAHLDSWAAGDGAADNAAGSAIVMEAARILSSLKLKPKRTIRFALWNAEEQGSHGSYHYVDRYLAKRPADRDPYIASAWPWNVRHAYPVTPLAGYKDLAGYFNVDNGSGKIRGVYAEGNLAVVPIFKDWLSSLPGLGASAVVVKPVLGTDHLLFSRAGLPGFQFIQDPLDYDGQVHHSDLDTFDHLRTDDLRQASVVLAAFLWAAAERDAPLPTNTLPTQPRPSDPFKYEDPRTK